MTPTSRARWRKAAWPLGIVAALIVGLALCEWRGWPFLQGPMESRLSQRLQRELRFGEDFALKLFGSIRFRSDALRIGPPQGPQADPALGGDLVNASRVWLQVPYSTVFGFMDEDNQAPPRISSLRFGRVDASLKRLADGRSNWSFGPPKKQDPAQPFDMPHFDELVVESGRITLNDAVSKTTMDATVSTSEGGLTGAGAKPAGLAIQGKGSHEQRPFDFRVTSSGVLPLVARGNAQPVPVTMRLNAGANRFAFDGTGTDVLRLQALDGAASLSGRSLAEMGDAIGVTLPTTAPFTLRGRLSKADLLWSLKQALLDVGESRLGGQFSFDRAPKVPMLSGELNGSRMVLSDLLPAFGAPVHGAPNPKPPPGQVLPHREFDVPKLHAMNANVKVRLARAELGRLFRQPLAPLHGDLSLASGVLKLDNILTRAAGGELKGGIGLDANPPQPLWDVDLRWSGIELDKWLRPRAKASARTGPSGEKPGYVTGKLGGHADLKGRGKSTDRLVASLNGTLQAWVRDGSISHLVVEGAGIDIYEALGLLIRGDDRLPMHCAVVRAKMGDGIMVPEVGLVDTGDSTVLLTGSLSLADEKLDLTLITKPKDVSPVTLRSPVKIQGTFSDPQVKLDARQLASKAGLAAVLGSVVHPLAALVPLFDPGEKESAGGCRQTLAKLRDADGPAGSPAAKAPRPTDKNLAPEPAPPRQAAAPPTVRK